MSFAAACTFSAKALDAVKARFAQTAAVSCSGDGKILTLEVHAQLSDHNKSQDLGMSLSLICLPSAD